MHHPLDWLSSWSSTGPLLLDPGFRRKSISAKPHAVCAGRSATALSVVIHRDCLRSDIGPMQGARSEHELSRPLRAPLYAAGKTVDQTTIESGNWKRRLEAEILAHWRSVTAGAQPAPQRVGPIT